jgi:hypothetical protein
MRGTTAIASRWLLLVVGTAGGDVSVLPDTSENNGDPAKLHLKRPR